MAKKKTHTKPLLKRMIVSSSYFEHSKSYSKVKALMEIKEYANTVKYLTMNMTCVIPIGKGKRYMEKHIRCTVRKAKKY